MGTRLAEKTVVVTGGASGIGAAIESTVARFGRLDVYFNNAGMNSPMRFLDITERNFETVMTVNALGVLTCPPRCSSRRAIPTTSRVRSSPSRAA